MDATRQIVGLTIVRDEDLFIRPALLNAVDFCDRLIVADHQSRDGTAAIVKDLAARFSTIEYHEVGHPREAHRLIAPLAGTPTWIFAVDGDEIYDPAGLRQLRPKLLGGEYDPWWQVFGNVLNCATLDPRARQATGYLAPPCRSMTKLFNFAAIRAWENCPGPLMGGAQEFVAPWHAGLRLDLHLQTPWEQALFKCLHLCFLRRSSLEAGGRDSYARLNMSERRNQGPKTRLITLVRQLLGQPRESSWKKEKYMRGPLVPKDVAEFFPA